MMSFHFVWLFDLVGFDVRARRLENAARPVQRIAFDLRRNRDGGLSPKSCLFETQPAHNGGLAPRSTPKSTNPSLHEGRQDREDQPEGDSLLPVILSEAKNPLSLGQPRLPGFFASLRMTILLSARSAVKISGLGKGAKDGFRGSSLKTGFGGSLSVRF
jgi:hypothetical protein